MAHNAHGLAQYGNFMSRLLGRQLSKVMLSMLDSKVDPVPVARTIAHLCFCR